MRVVPLVLEHFGRWGKKAESYLDDLSKRSRDDFGRPNRAKLLRKISNHLQDDTSDLFDL